jgi:hypothetical protein
VDNNGMWTTMGCGEQWNQLLPNHSVGSHTPLQRKTQFACQAHRHTISLHSRTRRGRRYNCTKTRIR